MQILYVRSYESIVSFAVSGGIIPREQKKIFRLATLAIIFPPTCESESEPLTPLHAFAVDLLCDKQVFSCSFASLQQIRRVASRSKASLQYFANNGYVYNILMSRCCRQIRCVASISISCDLERTNLYSKSTAFINTDQSEACL
jgi:hypothetical protein